MRGGAAKALAWCEKPGALIMPTYDLAWNRKRLTWSQISEFAPCQLECLLVQRTLIEGHQQMRIIGRLAGILEDELDNPVHCEKFWHDAQRRLGKLGLSQREIWQIEIMLAKRIARPVSTHSPAAVRSSKHRIQGPHRPLRQKMLRTRL